MPICKSRVPVSVRRVLVPKETVRSGDMGFLYRYGGCWYRISSACDVTVAIPVLPRVILPRAAGMRSGSCSGSSRA